MTETPADKPAQETAKAAPADDPILVRARLDYELAKIALDKERLGLTDQSERAKLLKGMIPDFGSVEVKEDTITTSDQPSALSDCLLQHVIFNVVDDIADTVMQAMNRVPRSDLPAAGSPWTFWVTSDTSHIEQAAAYRDVTARLERLQSATDRACPAQPRREHRRRQLQLIEPLSVVSALLGAVPGAITMATRLFANQYTTSTYTSTTPGGVDLHAAGAIASRVARVPGTKVRVRRLQTARDTRLEEQVLTFATALDGRVNDARSRARVAAAAATAKVDQLARRRAQLASRADDVVAAWKDKAGKSAASAGLAEDLALI